MACSHRSTGCDLRIWSGFAFRPPEQRVRFAPIRTTVSHESALNPLHLTHPTLVECIGTSRLCHVWTAPSWQGLSSRRRTWSVQPCVRPLSAVRMTAGHNALRGSGPGHKPAFKDALAQVGCPDRRIDRLCITCCSSSQPSHHARYSARSRYGLSAIG